MEGVELAIPTAVAVSKLMGSEVLAGARVCATEGEASQPDCVSSFSAPKIGECSSTVGHRGISSISGPCSQMKKIDTGFFRGSSVLDREDSSRTLEQGIISGAAASISGFEGKPNQRKAGKVPRNGIGPLKKLRMSQPENSLLRAEADDMKIESDKLGSHLVKCSNAEKSQASKHKNVINGRRGDRRNTKVQVKAKYDTFLLKAGLPTFNPANGGSNALGTHGPKPDVQDVTKLIDDVSLTELLDGSYKRPNIGKDTENKASDVNKKVIDSVMKACSILRLQGRQRSKETEGTSALVDKKIPSLPSPSNTSATNSPDGDESSCIADLSKYSNDKDCSIKGKALADVENNTHLYQPRDILERLALPSPRDLDSLLQDAVKPAASVKFADSRSTKPISSRVSLPPFSWSHSFNGHHKSNNDAMKTSNRSTCQGRWARIRSSASCIGGGSTESFVDLDSLTYDGSLVPPGKVKYRLPEIKRASPSIVAQHSSIYNLSSTVCPTGPQPSPAPHCSQVLVAAQTLCDMATHSLKQHSNGIILNWPKQPSQKSMKARKSRSSEKLEEEFLTPKSEPGHHHEAKASEHGSVAKKPKLSIVEKRQDFSHVQAVIGLTSVSAPRSSWPSPIKFSRDSIPEARNPSGSYIRPPFTTVLPPRVLDRGNHNPQKARKVTPMDWNRTRS